MRGYVVKQLTTTEVVAMAQPLDGSGVIEIPITIPGNKEIESTRKVFTMLEKVAGLEDKAVIFGIVSSKVTKTTYRMPIDEFIEVAEVLNRKEGEEK